MSNVLWGMLVLAGVLFGIKFAGRWLGRVFEDWRNLK
jgi:hypothetical protein